MLRKSTLKRKLNKSNSNASIEDETNSTVSSSKLTESLSQMAVDATNLFSRAFKIPKKSTGNETSKKNSENNAKDTKVDEENTHTTSVNDGEP